MGVELQIFTSDGIIRLGHALSFFPSFLGRQLTGSVSPALAGYKITHRCNLSCSHCPYWGRTGQESDYQGVVQTLKRLKGMGVKILIIEGGEPMLWRSGKREIRDVTRFASKLFPSVCITTNGLIPWEELDCDRVWVSLDGPEAVHDSIRGPGVFKRVIRNIEKGPGNEVMVSFTISSLNKDFVEETLRELKGLIRGITFQFYYPYKGVPDSMFLSGSLRRDVLDQLLSLKREGLPVANSFSSLKEMKKERFTCIDTLLANAEPDGSITQGCYLKNRAGSNCELCGFTAHNEISLAYKGKLESIMTGMRIFFGGPER
jgi:MoaA/NifB/PqqE/SkfB family radical SAM enzyme